MEKVNKCKTVTRYECQGCSVNNIVNCKHFNQSKKWGSIHFCESYKFGDCTNKQAMTEAEDK